MESFSPDRRQLLQATGISAAMLAAADGPAHAASADGAPASADFSDQSAAMRADRVVTTACQFCNSLCGLRVHLRAGRVIDVRGEPNDPVQAGEICVKAGMMPQLVYNRFRLTRPLKRIGGDKGDPQSRFEPITWDEALERIARKMLDLREAKAIVSRMSGRLPRGTGSLIHRC